MPTRTTKSTKAVKAASAPASDPSDGVVVTFRRREPSKRDTFRSGDTRVPVVGDGLATFGERDKLVAEFTDPTNPDNILRMSAPASIYSTTDPSVSEVTARVTILSVSRFATAAPKATSEAASDTTAPDTTLALLIAGGNVTAIAKYLQSVAPKPMTLPTAKAIAAGLLPSA